MTDFLPYITERVRHFTGREWAFSAVNDWLANPDGERIFLLTGDPGTGKSAVAARLVQISLGQVETASCPKLGKDSLAYFHFCQAQNDSTLNPLRFVETLSTSLANRYPPFAKALLKTSHREINVIQNVGTAVNGSNITGIAIQSLNIGNLSARAAFDWAIYRPLETLYTPPFDEVILVLVDSMDEALTYNPDENIPQLLADATSSSQNLPGKVRFLLTSRPDQRILELLGNPSLDLIVNAQEDVDDVRAYAVHRLGNLSEHGRTELAGRIAEASRGNFLYARYVLDEISAQAEALTDPATLALPEGLDDIYRQFIRRELARNKERWSDRYRPLLGLLAVARSPGLTSDHLAAGSELPPSKTDDALVACSQYLTGSLPNGPFTIYHQSFREFLLKDPEYNVYPTEAEQTLGEIFLQAYGENWATCEDDYALRNTPGHLARAAGALTQPLQRLARRKLKEALSGLLLDFSWLQVKLKTTDIATVIADYELLLAGREVGLVRDALRLSAHVLVRDRTQLAGQLLGRLIGCSEDKIQVVLEQAASYHEASWLHPLTPSLEAPGGALLRTMTGHGSGINGLALTPNGQRLVSASSDRTLKVWDLASGTCERTLTGHRKWVSAVAVTADGERAVSASWDTTLKIWNLRTGALERTLKGHQGAVLSVAVTVDGCWVVSGSTDSSVKIWDIRLKSEENLGLFAPVITLTGHTDAVNAVAVTSDWKRIISASRDHTLKIWRISTNPDSGQIEGALEFTLAGHGRSVEAISIMADEQAAISASEDCTMMVWDLRQVGPPKLTITGLSESVRAVAVSVGGRMAVSGSSDKTIRIWNLSTGRLEHTLLGHSEAVKAVALTRDSKHIMSGSSGGTLKVWIVPSGMTAGSKFQEKVRPLGKHAAMVACIAVTSDRKKAISASADGTLKIWNLRTCTEERTLAGHSETVRSVTAFRNGVHVVSVSWDKSFKLWNLRTGEAEKTISSGRPYINAVAAIGNGLRVATVSEDTILRIWDLETGKLEREIPTSHLSQVSALAVTPDGKYAVTASTDRTIKLWNLVMTTEIFTLEGHQNTVVAVAVTDDGSRALSVSRDLSARIWDLQCQTEERILAGHNSRVYGAAMTGDGKLAITGSEDQSVRVYRVSDGSLIATFTCDGLITTCSAVDQRTFLVGDALGRIHFLKLEVSSQF